MNTKRNMSSFIASQPTFESVISESWARQLTTQQTFSAMRANNITCTYQQVQQALNKKSDQFNSSFAGIFQR